MHGCRLKLPKVIGHRGASAKAPENTLASFRLAASLGVKWIECDIQLTRDGELVVIHDMTLDRTTDGSGSVIDNNYKYITSLDAVSWYSSKDNSAGVFNKIISFYKNWFVKYKTNDSAKLSNNSNIINKSYYEYFIGDKVPGINDLIACLYSNNLGVNLELKPAVGYEKNLAVKMVEVLNNWPKQVKTPLVSSFSMECLEELVTSIKSNYGIGNLNQSKVLSNNESLTLPDKNNCGNNLGHQIDNCCDSGINSCSSGCYIGLLFEGWSEEIFDWVKKLNPYSVHLPVHAINQEKIKLLKNKNLKVLVYTVNDPAVAKQLFDWGVDSIFSDLPDGMLNDLG